MQNIGKQLHRVQRRIHAVDHGGFVAECLVVAVFLPKAQLGADHLEHPRVLAHQLFQLFDLVLAAGFGGAVQNAFDHTLNLLRRDFVFIFIVLLPFGKNRQPQILAAEYQQTENNA